RRPLGREETGQKPTYGTKRTGRNGRVAGFLFGLCLGVALRAAGLEPLLLLGQIGEMSEIGRFGRAALTSAAGDVQPRANTDGDSVAPVADLRGKSPASLRVDAGGHLGTLVPPDQS